MDQVAYDLFLYNCSRQHQMYRALVTDSCHGFNTYGYFKSQIDNFSSPQCFHNGHGTFIKRSSLQKISDYEILLNESSLFKRSDAIVRLQPSEMSRTKVVVVTEESKPERKLIMTMEL